MGGVMLKAVPLELGFTVSWLRTPINWSVVPGLNGFT